MLPLEEATARILAKISPLAIEEIALSNSYRRIAARDIPSPINLPGFDNSAMDGYAVISKDLSHATESRPVKLECLGEMSAGGSASTTVTRGTCMRIFTGAPLPEGADAVVMQEETRRLDGDPGSVLVIDQVKPWENIRFSGEDVKVGSKILRTGDRIGSGQIAVAAACGVSLLKVGKHPKVGLLATGDELVEPGGTLAAGQIFESNRTTLSQLVTRAGGVAVSYPIVPDDLKKTCDALITASNECDVVVTSGAVSVGDRDHVKPAVEKLGGSLDFWRVSVRPGKPFVFGKVQGKHFFGLPGNPISSFVTFLLLVRPAILKLQGATQLRLPTARGVLSEPFENRGNRRHFARVAIDATGQVRSAGLQASHALSSLANANGLIDVPPDSVWKAGQVVAVHLIDD